MAKSWFNRVLDKIEKATISGPSRTSRRSRKR